MLQCQCLEAREGQRRAELVVGEFQVLGGERHMVLEPGEDEDVLRPLVADQRPGEFQLADIVLGAGQDLAAGIGQVRRVPVAEAVDGHRKLPGSVGN